MSLESLKSKRVVDVDQKRADLRFWKAEEPFRAVFANATRLSRYASARRMQAFYYACLYNDSELAAMIQGSQATRAESSISLAATAAYQRTTAGEPAFAMNRRGRPRPSARWIQIAPPRP